MKKSIIKNKIKGLGFIEVLIAIVVVGIVSSVFLTIAGHAMKSLVQTERIEYMARIARDARNIAQEVANQERVDILTNDGLFPNQVNECYFPQKDGDGDETVYKFAKNESDEFLSEPTSTSREALITFIKNNNLEWYIAELEDEVSWKQDYFVIMCIQSIDETSRWAHVEFRVGDVNLKGEKTDDTDIKDFIYYAIIEL
jgi:type II secretory pathway pseudopilin PulG